VRSEQPESRNALGSALIVLAAACFGTLGPLSRFAEEAGVGSLALVAWRAALGATVMLLFIAVGAALGRRFALALRRIPRRDLAFLGAAAVANAILNFAVFTAFLRISIALALLIFYLYPALVALVSVLWLGERLDRVRWVALDIFFAGLVLVLAGAGGLGTLDLVGIGLAFLGGVAQVFYVLAARHGFSHVPAPQAAAMTMGGGGLLYLLAAVVIGQAGVLAQPLDSAAAFWPVLVAGVVGAGVPTVSYITGIRLLGPPRAAILAMLEPVIGVVLAAWLLSEQPTLIQLVGGALVIAGAVIIQLRPRAEFGEHEAVPIGT
jgi:drug/metabolite transporter, DME family